MTNLQIPGRRTNPINVVLVNLFFHFYLFNVFIYFFNSFFTIYNSAIVPIRNNCNCYRVSYRYFFCFFVFLIFKSLNFNTGFFSTQDSKMNGFNFSWPAG